MAPDATPIGVDGRSAPGSIPPRAAPATVPSTAAAAAAAKGGGGRPALGVTNIVACELRLGVRASA
eukprot:7056748-Prymnesium_polylepis.1